MTDSRNSAEGETMTIEEIYAIPVNGEGWRILPNGNKVRLGQNVTAPYGINGAQIGNGARIGNEAQIGNRAQIGTDAQFGNGAQIGNGARIGNGAQIGNGARIEAKATWLKSPLAVQGTKHLVTNCAPGKINIGCEIFTFDEFLSATPEERAAYQAERGYSPEECAEYIKIVKFVIANGI